MTPPTAASDPTRPVIHMALAAPTFIVPDVAASLRWYADQLGFRITGTFPPAPPYGYASIGRDGVELMFLCLSGYAKPDLRARRPEGIWDAYIRMSGVEAYYDSLKHAPFIHSPLIQRSYGDREFEVIDPDGYIVVFSG